MRDACNLSVAMAKFRASVGDWIFFSGVLWGLGATVFAILLPIRATKAGEIQNWPARELKVTGQTGINGEMHSWAYWQEETCDKYILYSDKSGSITSKKSAEAQQGLTIDGAKVQCTTMGVCRDHIALRCTLYRSVDMAGMRTILFSSVGVGFYAFSCVVVVLKINMRIASALSIAGSLCVLYGVTWFAIVTDAMQNTLATHVFWPYATLGGGYWGAIVFGLAMLSCALSSLNLVVRQKPSNELEEELMGEEEEIGDEDEYEEQ